FYSCSHIVLVLFFFQAEDGIRDPLVTGVQTCALPISPRACARIFAIPTAKVGAPPARDRMEFSPMSTAVWLIISGVIVNPQLERSEERRVGKECRSRWTRAEQKGRRRAARGI